MLPPVGIEPRPLINSDSKSNTLLSTLTCHVLLRRSLNFCSCTTWFLDLDDLVTINRAWLYKDLKVSVLQANVNLVQKGVLDLESEVMRGPGSIPTGGNIVHWIFFLISHRKVSAANIGIIAIRVHFGKLYWPCGMQHLRPWVAKMKNFKKKLVAWSRCNFQTWQEITARFSLEWSLSED